MYHLHQTDRLEDAAVKHAALLQADPDAPPTLVIVQSAHMQRWLSLVLSRRRGIWFQPDFATPDSGLRQLLKDMLQDDGSRPPRTLFMDDLKYLSFRTLGALNGSPDFAQQYPVLAGLLSPETLVRNTQKRPQAFSRQRLYELADTIAGMFFGYSQLFWSASAGAPADSHIFRLWENGASLMGAGEMAVHEEWQKRLYLGMFPANRSFDILGYQTYRAAAERWKYRGPYRRIVLFGSAFLSSQAFALFRSLADSGMDVHHILLTPSPALEATPQSVAALSTLHPLDDWSSLLQPFIEDASRANIEKSALLQRKTVPIPEHFRLFSCTTPQREVQSLKQNLLALMASLRESGSPLLPQEIAIMAPDIRRYRPWLEAYFPSRDENGFARSDHLALNIVDLNFGTGSVVISALERLLTLGSSRLERHTVLELLDNSAICMAIGLDDAGVESFRNWSSAYEVRWGLNAPQRHALETGTSWSNTWDKALRRLFEDMASGAADAGSAEIEAVGRVADYLHGVIETLESWEAGQKDLTSWVRELRGFLDQRLQAPDDDENRILDQIRSAAGNLLQIAKDLGNPQMRADELDWTGFRILFNDQIAHLSGGRGQHQIDGITCSSLRPYRAIPFRLIALLGMNEGEIPRRDTLISFDLSRNAGRSRGLITNRIQDNYAWLETLVSAREWLWVFYAGRDPATGEELSCAPMVQETVALSQTVTATQSAPALPTPIIVQEPILSFDARYFTREGAALGLVNTSPDELALARRFDSIGGATSTPEILPKNHPFFRSVFPEDRAFIHGKDGLGLDLSMKELSDFVLNPVRTHVRDRLGIRLDRHEQNDVESLDLLPWIAHDAVRELAGALVTIAGAAGDSSENSDDRILGMAATIAREKVASERENDTLFDGPFSEQSLSRLSRTLSLVENDLRVLLQSGSSVPTPDQQDFEQERELSVRLPSMKTDGSWEYLAPEKVKIRLAGSLNSLWHLPQGAAWVVISNSQAAIASSIKSKHFLNFALARAVCAALGKPVPERLIHISVNPAQKGASQILDLSAPDIGDFELDLDAVLEAWLVNLVHPLPFYSALTSRFIGGIAKPGAIGTDSTTQDASNSTTNDSPALNEYFQANWQDSWKSTMEKEDYQVREFGIPEKAVHCASWKLLSPGGFDAPPWYEWYADLLEKVWLPLWHRRNSFIKGYRKAESRGKKK